MQRRSTIFWGALSFVDVRQRLKPNMALMLLLSPNREQGQDYSWGICLVSSLVFVYESVVVRGIPDKLPKWFRTVLQSLRSAINDKRNRFAVQYGEMIEEDAGNDFLLGLWVWKSSCWPQVPANDNEYVLTVIWPLQQQFKDSFPSRQPDTGHFMGAAANPAGMVVKSDSEIVTLILHCRRRIIAQVMPI